ncbi:MAG: NADP-dependent isocitrate dehydrogenase [Proteobacteria bacterium]|nr:NADP-dependent isocitrate dehydrogenase [Pseudomonadota bacterium]
MKKTPITVAHGDGIGPEIMAATLKILDAAGAPLEITTVEAGQKVYERGITTGIEPHAIEAIRSTGVLLKAPIFTPSGGGYKSLNVTIRKLMSLYANVRPCQSYHPYIEALHKNMDLVVVRENEEDLYAGIEHRQTQGVCQALKLISRPGCERIIRYAFEYARANGRKKVTCMVKDNIMKMVDGLFYQVFEEIAPEYPDIQKDRYIIDIGAARIASRPQDFDVIVTENLYGDIISDIAAEVTGSVGLGISANIGEQCAMFEAMHGTAPDIAGRGIANPSGLLLGSIMMLTHCGHGKAAETVHNAWFKTIEDGIHTGDIYRETTSKQKVGTDDFTNAVIARLGKKPSSMNPVSYPDGKGGIKIPALKPVVVQKKEWIGVDAFIEYNGKADDLAEKVKPALASGLELSLLSNRGVKCWPKGSSGTFCTDHWCARILGKTDTAKLVETLQKLEQAGVPVVKTENLYSFDGKDGFTAAAG